MGKEGVITISLERYTELMSSERFLGKLMAAGVDNWDGYEDCLDEEEEE